MTPVELLGLAAIVLGLAYFEGFCAFQRVAPGERRGGSSRARIFSVLPRALIQWKVT